MDPAILIQKRIRDNTDALERYIIDMKTWIAQTKKKEQDRKKEPTVSQLYPPVRKRTKQSTPDNTGKNTRISSCDYSSWNNFDVEKACEEVDLEVPLKQSCTLTEEEEDRLRDEAVYEKELGNQHVKRQNWNDAIHCYSRAIQRFPYDATYYANRALCYLKINNLKFVDADCTSALQLDDTYVKAYHRRAAARMGLRQYIEAKEDLIKVLELEPNNTAAKCEMVKVEKKLNPPQWVMPVKNKVQEKKRKKKVQIQPEPQSDKETKTRINHTIESIKPKVYVFPGGDDEVCLIEAIRKPPQLRSRKSMKRIPIEDVTDDLMIEKYENELVRTQLPGEGLLASVVTDSDLLTQPVEEEMRKQESICVRAADPAETSIEVPPVPQSSVQFLIAWKKVKTNPDLRFLFLKQMSGAEFEQIFQTSLESNILSELVSTLATDFVPAGELVYRHLLGLSHVQRFSAITMFLSAADKAGIKKLLEHCVDSSECSQEEASLLAQKYEIH